MKKIKNKFIIAIIWLLIIILSIFFIKNSDKNLNSTALLKVWEANISRGTNIINLEPKIPYILNIWDTLTTSGSGSLLIINWWDGSVTRLWENSSMVVNNNTINNDLSKINISFELLVWKTWSNVTSFFWEESYFIQTFNDNEAAVRWTIFDVDLVNNYLHVSKHAVSIKNSLWKVEKIWESKAFNFETFTFIDLIDFIKNYKDNKWDEINKNLDNLHLDDLKTIMSDNLEQTWKFLQLDKLSQQLEQITDIKILNKEEKESIYNKLLSEYQKIHFADATTPELLGLKLDIKEIMLQFSNDKNEEYLVESTVFDLEEVKKTNNPFYFEKVINIFKNHKDAADRINLSLPTLFDISDMSNDLKAVLFSQFENVWNLLSEESIQWLSQFNIQDIESNLSEATQNFLNNNIKLPNLQDLWNKFKFNLPNFEIK